MWSCIGKKSGKSSSLVPFSNFAHCSSGMSGGRIIGRSRSLCASGYIVQVSTSSRWFWTVPSTEST